MNSHAWIVTAAVVGVGIGLVVAAFLVGWVLTQLASLFHIGED